MNALLVNNFLPAYGTLFHVPTALHAHLHMLARASHAVPTFQELTAKRTTNIYTHTHEVGTIRHSTLFTLSSQAA